MESVRIGRRHHCAGGGLLGHFLIAGHEHWLPLKLVVVISSYVYVALADLVHPTSKLILCVVGRQKTTTKLYAKPLLGA